MDSDWTILDPPLNPFEFNRLFPGKQRVGIVMQLQEGATLGYDAENQPIREILVGDVNVADRACGCCDAISYTDKVTAYRRVWTRPTPEG